MSFSSSSSSLPSSFAIDVDYKDAAGVSRKLRSRSCRSCVVCLLAILFLLFLLIAIVLTNISSQPLARRTDHVKEKFTVVINTFRRPDMLERAVEHYSRCRRVQYIHIIWSERKHAPPAHLLSKYSVHTEVTAPRIIFDQFVNDSLNNRFAPLSADFTEGIFSVDDDMRVPCEDLHLAFDVWRGNRESIVGFMPRIHVVRRRGGSEGVREELVYRCWWTVWVQGAYSIVLTKAAFLHHKYFALYSHHSPPGVLEFVDRGRNCEDIAMQFLVSNLTGLPPVYVKGHISDLGVLGGISTSRNIIQAAHMDARSNCLNELVHLFGGSPLQYSRFIVDSAANGWSNAPSAWGEYISSDLWNIF